MYIRRLDIEGFGALRGLVLEPDMGLTVIYGPNEAGKSTLLAFIRMALYGRTGKNGLAADPFLSAGGRMEGGSMLLETAGGERLRAALRYGIDHRGRQTKSWQVTVYDENGKAGGVERLAPYLGGITAEQFRNLFAFSLGELQEIRTLTGDELGSFLYSAGLGVRASDIVAAEKRLAQELDGLFTPRSRNRPLDRKLKEIVQLEAEVRRSRAETGRYNEWVKEIRQLDDRIREAEEALRAARERGIFLHTALKVHAHWLSLRDARNRLAELPPTPVPFPDNGLERQERLLQDLTDLSGRLDRVEARMAELAASLPSVTEEDDAILAADKPRVEALLERSGEYRSLSERALTVRAELTERKEQLRACCASLGPGWSPERLEASRPTLRHREEWKVWRDRLASQERTKWVAASERDEWRRKWEDAERKASERRTEWEHALGQVSQRYPGGRDKLVQLLKALPESVSAIRRSWQQAAQVEMEIKRLEQRAWDLETARLAAGAGVDGTARHQDRMAGTLKTAAVLLVILVAGLAGFLVWSGDWALAGVVTGSLGGLAAYIGIKAQQFSRDARSKRRRGRGSYSRPAERAEPADTLEQAAGIADRIQELERRLASIRAEMEIRYRTILAYVAEDMVREMASALAPEAGTGSAAASDSMPGPSHAKDGEFGERILEQLDRLDREARETFQLLERLEERHNESAREAAELKRQWEWAAKQAEEAESEWVRLVEQWKTWLKPWDETGSLAPDSVPELFRMIDQGWETLQRIRRLDMEQRELDERREQYLAELESLLGPAAREHPDAALRQRKQELDRLESRLRDHRHLSREIAELEAEKTALGRERERCRAELERLWASAGADGEDQFRALASRDAERKKLKETIRLAGDMLQAAVGPARFEDLLSLYETCGYTEIERLAEEAQREIEAWQQEIAALRDKRGRLSAEKEQLEQTADYSDKLQRLAEARGEFRELAGRWAVLAMCAGLYRKTRAIYERERQPQVLLRASELFSRMTGGRYSRVFAPVGENRLMVERPNGEQFDSSQLSRGTAEQLYLAMRFAMVEEYAKRVPLPVLMDDILVNFDRERLGLAVAEIGRLAERHQIILFTCHPHVAEAAQTAFPRHKRIVLGSC